MKPGKPPGLRRWSCESEEASWLEFTGQSARDERAAERENSGDFQRVSLIVQLSFDQCMHWSPDSATFCQSSHLF